jgi:hypothetical protein
VDSNHRHSIGTGFHKSKFAQGEVDMSDDLIVRFLAGWGIDNFRDKQSLTAYLLTHGVDFDGFNIFRKLQAGLELQIKGNKIEKLFEHYTNQLGELWKELKGDNIELPITEWPDHKVFFLKKSREGNHVLGGEKPKELFIPDDELLETLFQYIGAIDCTDPLFSWIGIPKLYLVYPLYECNSGIFLDYNDPCKPKILNPETFSVDWYDPDMEEIGNIEFVENKYTLTKNIDEQKFYNDDLLICGVPLWYQAPEIPICPQTQEYMKFVCTINSDLSIKIINKENHGKIPFRDYLIFGDHGHLFVFFHPVSRILHLSAQW